MNILLPMAGCDTLFNETGFPFPKPLVEIFDVPMIQVVMENLISISSENKFLFIVNESDCTKCHLDNVLSLLSSGIVHHIIKLSKETKGAACSALMAIEHINDESELLIANSDQLIASTDLNSALDYFRKEGADAGVACFRSVHPRWSYARTDQDGQVVELAEKQPISKQAIAGVYYFRKGHDFVGAAMGSILKDARVNDAFFVAPTINELILDGKKVLCYQIDTAKYHSFYSPQRIRDFCSQFSKTDMEAFK